MMKSSREMSSSDPICQDPINPGEALSNVNEIKAKEENASDDRGKWGHILDVPFACISATTCFVNVWRFPYLCFRNGGGAFILVYFIAMVLFGIPLFFQEIALGQYLGSGGLTLIGHFCPLLKGVGMASMTLVFFLNIYYCVTIAWTFRYLIATFTELPGLPWVTCDNWWNTLECYQVSDLTDDSNRGLHLRNSTSSSQEYWDYRVLQTNSGIEYGLGEFQFELAFCLLLSWVIVYGIIYKGLYSSGKILWFTALFPFAILAVLLVRAVTLEGAFSGLAYYFYPDWSKVFMASTWNEAFLQVVYNFNIGLGCLPALGSYSKFHHNTLKDVLVTCVLSAFTSLLMGVLVFSLVGFQAHVMESDITDVITSGPALVFVTFPDLVVRMPVAPLWAFIFFLMLIVIGVSSQVCVVEGLVTGIVDNWPCSLTRHRKKFTLGLCILLFLLGVPICSEGGIYLFMLMDKYCAGMSLILVCLFQSVAIGWVCGEQAGFTGVMLGSKFKDCLTKMTGRQPNLFWIICWKFVIPLIFLFLFIFDVASYHPVTYYGGYEYPRWAEGLGLLMLYFSLFWVPAYAVYYLIRLVICPKQPGTILQKLRGGLALNMEGNLGRQEGLELNERL